MCPIQYSWIVEATRGSFAACLAVFGVASNSLTILIFLRIPSRSATENLLLAVTAADLLLPLVHLVRQIYVSFDNSIDEVRFFRIFLFYLWHVFSVISILLTLVLALRRVMAIKYPHRYQTLCSRKYTYRVLVAVCVFSAVFFLPILFHRTDLKDPARNARRKCKAIPSREIFYSSITLATLHLSGNVPLTVSHWSYVVVFEILCPFILAGLSVT